MITLNGFQCIKFHLIVVDVVGSVDVHGLVGVNTDADLTDVGVDEAGRVTSFQVGEEALHVDLGQEDKVPDPDLQNYPF